MTSVKIDNGVIVLTWPYQHRQHNEVFWYQMKTIWCMLILLIACSNKMCKIGISLGNDLSTLVSFLFFTGQKNGQANG